MSIHRGMATMPATRVVLGTSVLSWRAADTSKLESLRPGLEGMTESHCLPSTDEDSTRPCMRGESEQMSSRSGMT
jgi:hypothetical protein